MVSIGEVWFNMFLTRITFTAKSDPDVEGNTMFTAGYEKEDFGPVKSKWWLNETPYMYFSVHNVSAPVISKVDFSLPPYQLNKWPIKIGRLLREASKPNNQLVLFVDSVTPVHFYFSKCGFAAKRIPSTIDRSFMLNATQINSLKIIYNKKCGKPWLDGIIELELIADRAHTRGTFEIKLVKDSEPMESLEQKAEEEEEQPSIEIIAIRLVLVSLLIVVICCAGILSESLLTGISYNKNRFQSTTPSSSFRTTTFNRLFSRVTVHGFLLIAHLSSFPISISLCFLQFHLPPSVSFHYDPATHCW